MKNDQSSEKQDEPNSNEPKTIKNVDIKSKGQLNLDNHKITQMSAGLNHILFLTENGLV